MKILKTPIAKNLFANFYGVGINLFNQILLVPFYLTLWGVEKYSDWIVLTTVTSFFAMSDIGLNTVTSNRFSIKISEGDRNECSLLLTNNYVLLLIVASLSIIGITLFALTVDLVELFGLHVLSNSSARYVLIVLVIHVFMGMASGVINAVYRAFSLTSKSTYLDNTVRLAEGLILLLGLLLQMRIEVIVTLYLIPRLIVLIFKHYNTKKLYPYKFRLSEFQMSLLKKILLPSFTFMSFPVGNAIVLQGFTLIVNKYFDANSLVLFNTTRTMSNFVKSIMGTIATAVWPEFSIAFGKKNYSKMRKIHRFSLFSSTAAAVVVALFLLIFGNFIYTVWTQGQVIFDFNLMAAFLLVLIVNNVWYTSSVTLMATNNHSKLGVIYVSSTVFSLILAFVLIPIWHSLIATVFCLLIVDILLSFYSLKGALKLTKDSFSLILKESIYKRKK